MHDTGLIENIPMQLQSNYDNLPLYVRKTNPPFRSCARDLVIASLTMYHGTVLAEANKKSITKNSPMMHCQLRSSQISSGTSEW